MMVGGMDVIHHNDRPEQYLYKENKRPYNYSYMDDNKTLICGNYCNVPTMLGIKTLYYDRLFEIGDDSPSRSYKNITNVAKGKRKILKQKKTKRLMKSKERTCSLTTYDYLKILSKKDNVTNFQQFVKQRERQTKRRQSDTHLNTSTPYRTKFVVNTVLLDPQTKPQERQHVLKHPLMQAQLKIYRCQLASKEESCCCACNSDAMFEIMKGLYDCYKKKNCDHCDCILCGKLSDDERKLKSKVGVGVETASPKQRAKEAVKTAKEQGLLTTLTGKPPQQQDKIVRGLANLGLPLPEGKTESEKKLIDKVRQELGLPPTPKTAADREKYEQAAKLGLMQPLEGKTKPEKEKILQQYHDIGIKLPDGKTQSEKSLIDKIKASPRMLSATASQKLAKAKAAGFLTTLDGKTSEQKEKIVRGLAQSGLPLPAGETPFEKKLINNVRKELGLPPEPKTPTEKERYIKAQAAGLITPLEGKTPAEKEKILRRLAEKGIPFPEGRTISENALINKVSAEVKPLPPATEITSEKPHKAKTAGFLTTLDGKTPEQKEKIVYGLARSGLPLPEGKTASERKLIDKVRKDFEFLPSAVDECICSLVAPESSSGKSAILEENAKAAGFLTPLEGKTPEQKENGLPPEPKTAAEKNKYNKAQAAGLITSLESKLPAEKENILRGLPDGRTPSEKSLIKKIQPTVKSQPSVTGIPSEKLRRARAAGLLTSLKGKTPEQKEKILRGLVKHELPLLEGKTPSEKNVVDKIRKEFGLPPEPKSSAEKIKYGKAQAAGLITPLEGKTPARKAKILKGLAERGIPLPEGRTPSEKTLIKKIQAEVKPSLSTVGIPSEKMRKAIAAGLLTPLAGKIPQQKEKILHGLAQLEIPLPIGKTASEKKLIDKVRKELRLPPEPMSTAEKIKYAKARADGLITPLEGKTPAQKEKILKGLIEKGIPLPEGRTLSEKTLIKKIQAEVKPSLSIVRIASEKMRKARAAGLLTPLAGKTPEQKEKILRGLPKHGLPLLQGKTPSEKNVVDKIRKEFGLPPEPKSSAEKVRYGKAQAVGLITPLEGKTPAQKARILKGLAERGIPLPEGRTPSEKTLIKKIQADIKPSLSMVRIPSEKMRKARAAGLLTPLAGKTPEQKEKILHSLAQHGIPLPIGKTASEKKLIDKVRKELGLPPEPISSAEKIKYTKAQAAGLITPLEGKTPSQKEKILRELTEKGIPLPEGRTTSEKALIKKIQAKVKPVSSKASERKSVSKGFAPGRGASEKLRSAKAADLLTPLDGKTPEHKEKIIRRLAQQGLPLPEGKTESEKIIINKVRNEMGLPPEPKTFSMKEKYKKALAAGVITPLEGKTPAEKKKILKNMKTAGLELPQGRTRFEKSMIRGVQVSESASGILTQLEGKTPEQKEKILRGLVRAGLPLPKGKTSSEKALINSIYGEVTKKTKAANLSTTTAGKSKAEKERILKELAKAGLTMPEGDTLSEKEMVRQARLVAGKPTEHTLSEKKRYKDMKTGTEGLRKVAKGRLTRSVAGLQEEVQEIVKTGKCEKACGCDKKKIRFKHSYVKIRVTSPDISSFCPCPNECIPRVKAGVFTNSEGIKVTVGSVITIPSVTFQPPTTKLLFENKLSQSSIDESDNLTESQSQFSLKISSIGSVTTTESTNSKSTVYIYNSESDISITDIKRLLRVSLNNNGFENNLNDSRKRESSLSCIYQSCFATKQDDFQYGRAQTTASKNNLSECSSTDHVSTSRSRSYYTVDTESSTTLTSSSESCCSGDTISVLSFLARHFEQSSDSARPRQYKYKGYNESKHCKFMFKNTDLKPDSRKLRMRWSDASYSNMEGGVNPLNDNALYSQSDTDFNRHFQSNSPKQHRDYDQNILDTMTIIPSSKSSSGPSSVVLVVSTPRPGDGDSLGVHLKGTIPKFKSVWRKH